MKRQRISIDYKCEVCSVLSITFKKRLIVLLLLVFTGQTMAVAAMPCHWPVAEIEHCDHHLQNSAHPSMHGENNSHTKIAASLMDCCKTGQHCLASGCAVAMHDAAIFSMFPKTKIFAGFYLVMPVTPPDFCHFRPPIFI